MRFSDPCLLNIVHTEFEEAFEVWNAHGVHLPVSFIWFSGGTPWCGDALEIIQRDSDCCIDLVLLFAPAMSYNQFVKFHEESAHAVRKSEKKTQV
eukprot:12113508-Karenia_brevis.AAC.1